MRRIYIAVALALISVTTGIFTSTDITARSEKQLNNIKKIEAYIKNKKLKKAEKLCKKTADEFSKKDSKIMYLYYIHSDLSYISENLYSMHGYLKRRRLNEYYYIADVTKNRLQVIIDKEPINPENIM